jgi:hypothetical protein
MTRAARRRQVFTVCYLIKTGRLGVLSRERAHFKSDSQFNSVDRL